VGHGLASPQSLLATAFILTAVNRGLDTTLGEGLKIEGQQFARLAATHDLREGLDAWIERRSPQYDGLWRSR